MSRNRILNVGSFMMDLVFTASRRPAVGETLIGSNFGMFTGGKGYNQAVAAARLGAQVTMLGALGEDYFADFFLSSLSNEGIETERITRLSTIGTGVACPTIFTEERNNSIIIVPNANRQFRPSEVQKNLDLFSYIDLLMLQLEVPIDTSFVAAKLAQNKGVPVLLNPAPYETIPDEMFTLIDILIPNEIEAKQLTGINVVDKESAENAAKLLMKKGPKQVIITLGANGALFCSASETIYAPAFEVSVVDPTAAGDAFCAGYAVAYLKGFSPSESLVRANAAGALASMIMGAEPSLPTEETVEEFIDLYPRHNK